jgi:hypothetical protein
VAARQVRLLQAPVHRPPLQPIRCSTYSICSLLETR